MAFRFNPDGSDFEVAGLQNFLANNYRIASNSFGTIWPVRHRRRRQFRQPYQLRNGSGNSVSTAQGPTGPPNQKHIRGKPPGSANGTNLARSGYEHAPPGQGAPFADILFTKADLTPKKSTAEHFHASDEPGPNVVRGHISKSHEHVARGAVTKTAAEAVKESDGAWLQGRI